MRDEVREYESFLQEYAPYGYAKIFARSGDFYGAQGALEDALVRGFADWRLRAGAPFRSHHALKFIEETLRAHGSNGEWTSVATVTSFSQSRKLRSIEEARDILRTFPEEDQVALVLLHVEELPAERVLDWLGMDLAALEDLRARLREKLGGWSPSTAVDEEPQDFFERALRQYRLSPQFVGTVMNRVRLSSIRGGQALRATAWVILFGFIAFFLFGWLGGGWREPWGYRSDPDAAFGLISLADVALIMFAIVACGLLRRYLLVHAPPALVVGTAARMAPLLATGALVGILFLAVPALVLLEPGIMNRRDDFWRWYVLLRYVWLAGSITAVLATTYMILVHYFRGLDRLAARARKAEKK